MKIVLLFTFVAAATTLECFCNGGEACDIAIDGAHALGYIDAANAASGKCNAGSCHIDDVLTSAVTEACMNHTESGTTYRCCYLVDSTWPDHGKSKNDVGLSHLFHFFIVWVDLKSCVPVARSYTSALNIFLKVLFSVFHFFFFWPQLTWEIFSSFTIITSSLLSAGHRILLRNRKLQPRPRKPWIPCCRHVSSFCDVFHAMIMLDFSEVNITVVFMSSMSLSCPQPKIFISTQAIVNAYSASTIVIDGMTRKILSSDDLWRKTSICWCKVDPNITEWPPLDATWQKETLAFDHRRKAKIPWW